MKTLVCWFKWLLAVAIVIAMIMLYSDSALNSLVECELGTEWSLGVFALLCSVELMLISKIMARAKAYAIDWIRKEVSKGE